MQWLGRLPAAGHDDWQSHRPDFMWPGKPRLGTLLFTDEFDHPMLAPEDEIHRTFSQGGAFCSEILHHIAPKEDLAAFQILAPAAFPPLKSNGNLAFAAFPLSAVRAASVKFHRNSHPLLAIFVKTGRTGANHSPAQRLDNMKKKKPAYPALLPHVPLPHQQKKTAHMSPRRQRAISEKKVYSKLQNYLLPHVFLKLICTFPEFSFWLFPFSFFLHQSFLSPPKLFKIEHLSSSSNNDRQSAKFVPVLTVNCQTTGLPCFTARQSQGLVERSFRLRNPGIPE